MKIYLEKDLLVYIYWEYLDRKTICHCNMVRNGDHEHKEKYTGYTVRYHSDRHDKHVARKRALTNLMSKLPITKFQKKLVWHYFLNKCGNVENVFYDILTTEEYMELNKDRECSFVEDLEHYTPRIQPVLDLMSC